MADELSIVEKAAHPVSIQHAPPYITRQPLYITNPTLLTPIQWREVAKEPITALCIRHIIREMVALDWEIVPEKPDEQEEQVTYFTRTLQEADDGDGWDVWLTRMLLDALELPIAGNAEMAPDDVSGMLGGLYHIDGATLFPTYDTAIPFVQINPYNGLDRVYFERGEMFRLLLQPRPDLVRKMYQTAPIESAFPSIEALSRIYLYYLKQLGDTPMVGILDLMDFSSEEAFDWATNFKEMLNGIDPLKIPILYDHVKPAKFIPFSRSPMDLEILETFKRYTEVVAAAFGLSIGDLRLFEHERTLAGVEASQRVTNRAGIGFYAQSIEDAVNRQVLKDYVSKLKFKFKQGATGEDLQEANLAGARATLLMTLTGNQPVLKPEDAQKAMRAWKMLPVEELSGVPAAPGLEGLGDLGGNLSSIDQDAEAIGELATEETKPDSLETIDQIAGEMGVKSVVKALLGDNLPQKLEKRRSITSSRFEKLLAAAFRQIGRGVTADKVQAAMDEVPELAIVKSLFNVQSEDELMTEAIVKAGESAAERLDKILAGADWWQMPDVSAELMDVLRQAYEEGAFQSAYTLQQQGFAQGATNQQTPQGFDFVLTNERVLFLIENYGAELVQNVDQGTKYFLRQKILSGAKQGASAREIAADIAQDLFKLKPGQAAKLSDTRIRSIVNTELNWADSRAMFDMMVACGLKTKGWITRGGLDVCDLCRGNEDLGFVELDYEYQTVFGEETTLHPPAHPSTCHCYLQSNPKELSSFFESGVGFWRGGDEPALKQAVEDETARIIRENKRARRSKSFGRPGLDEDSKTWQMLEEAGAVHMDILGVYRNTGNGKVFIDVGDWVSDATNAAIKQVFGDDVETDCEVGGPPDDNGNWQLIEPEKKSLPYSLWGYPDRPGKPARFDNEGDAQHWLITFGLVPVISDATFDVKGAGFKEAGVIWHRDGYVEANVLPVDELPEDDVVSGLATIFGGRGLKSTNVVKAHDGVMIALDVPPEIVDLLGEQPETTHITIAYLGKNLDGKPMQEPFDVASRHALLDVTESTIPFNVQLTGKIMTMGSGEVDAAEVKISDDLKQMRDDLMAALHRYGYPADATWSEFKPHVTVGDAGASEGLNPEAMNASWFATGLSLYVGGERTFWPFKGAPVGDNGFYKHLPSKHDQEDHGRESADAVAGMSSEKIRKVLLRRGYKEHPNPPDDLTKEEKDLQSVLRRNGVNVSNVSPLKGKIGDWVLHDVGGTPAGMGYGRYVIATSLKRSKQYFVLVQGSMRTGGMGAALVNILLEREGLEGVTKSLVADTWLSRVPDHYRFEFQQFVKSRSKEDDLSKISDEGMKRYYDDFMHSVFAFGFEYYKGADEYPPLVRSVVKSRAGWQTENAPAMLRAYLSGDVDVKGAVEWLWKSGYQVVPTSSEGDDMKSADVLALMKSMQEQNAQLMKGFAEALGAVAKSQPGAPAFNINLPENISLHTPEMILKGEAPQVTNVVNVPETQITVKNEVAPTPIQNRVNVNVEPTPIENRVTVEKSEIRVEQKAPVVNVTVPVPKVEVKNTVVVPKPSVVIQKDERKSKTFRVTERDADGNISEIEEDEV